jgi:hypothetical protein
MKIVIFLAILGILVMTGILGFAFVTGDFFAEGAALLQLPWGIVSLVDLYTGFIFFSGWIIFRERSTLRSILWVFFMMILGFFTASVYILVAAISSRGSWRKFWMGNRSDYS